MGGRGIFDGITELTEFRGGGELCGYAGSDGVSGMNGLVGGQFR